MTDGRPYTDADAPADEDGYTAEPWDLTAEQYVLGGMMQEPSVIDDVMETITPKDFYQPKHELIARAIGSLHRGGHPVDQLTVSDELRRTGMTERAGGVAYVSELVSLTPAFGVNAHTHAEIVHEHAVRRRLGRAAVKIGSYANASEGELGELVDKARAELDSVWEGRRRKIHPVGESMTGLVNFLEQPPTYYRTPWEALDKLIGGFAPGAFYVIGARPGSGKTIAALQAAARLAHEGVVAYSSLEMSELELQLRLVAQYGPIHMTRLRAHQLDQDEWKRVAEASRVISGAPIFVDETGAATMAQIRAHARSVARRGKLAGIVIDYLQLVEGEGESDRRVAVDAISRQAKHLAKDFQCPVIAAAQLRRAGARKGLPGLDDLREAGGIEQNADVVLLFDRDKDKKPNDLTVIVAKNRHGDLGRFTLHWDAGFARLRDKVWSPTALIDEVG